MHAFRSARQSDLADIIQLLADDDLGSAREVVSDPVDIRYLAAFAAIEADPNQLLAAAIDETDRVVGCLQLSFLPGLSRTGMWRPDRKRAHCEGPSRLRARLAIHRMGDRPLRGTWLRSRAAYVRQDARGFDPLL